MDNCRVSSFYFLNNRTILYLAEVPRLIDLEVHGDENYDNGVLFTRTDAFEF